MARSSGNPILETLVVFLLVAVAQFVTGLVGAMGGLFVLSAPVTDDPWTLITSVYAHGTLGHLLSNSVALVLFGWPVARATTRFRFHLFFVVTGALAGLAQVWLLAVAGVPVQVVGASGAIFALLGYVVAANPVSAGLASSVDVPRWLVWLVAIGLAAGITIATASPRAALIAHFTGLLLGLVAGRARLLQVDDRRPAEGVVA